MRRRNVRSAGVTAAVLALALAGCAYLRMHKVTVTGHAYSGSDSAGIRVEFDDATVLTDSDGSYQVELFASETRQVTVRFAKDGFTPEELTITVDVDDGEKESTVNMPSVTLFPAP